MVEGGGSTFPRNIGTVLTEYTASCQQKIFIVIPKFDSIVNVLCSQHGDLKINVVLMYN
jgi:hypothetical protein